MMLANGARPVPVPSKYSVLPGVRLSCTSVPTGLRPTRIESPTWMFCSRDVSGPFATLMLKNSSSGS